MIQSDLGGATGPSTSDRFRLGYTSSILEACKPVQLLALGVLELKVLGLAETFCDLSWVHVAGSA